jgi:hypothetical protein
MNFYSVNKKIFLALLLLPLSYSTTIKPEAHVFSAALSFISGAGLIFGGLCLKDNYKKLLSTLEEQLIQDWIAQNNLNQFGEPQETVYPTGNPLNQNQSRIDYIKNNHSKKPWFKGYKKLIKPISTTPLTVPIMIISGIGLLFAGKYFAQRAMK